MKSYFHAACFSLLFLASAAGTESNIQDFIGEWQAFIVNQNEITCQTQIRYLFHESGKWSILQEGICDEQGWFRLQEKNRILLQPRSAALKGECAAITAERLNSWQFMIRNPLNRNLALLFEKKSRMQPLQINDLLGCWKILQKNLQTKEIRTAPFTLTFHADGKYSVNQPGKVLPKEWSSGHYKITNNLVYLNNKHSGEGLWNRTVFFWYNRQLNYNNIHYRLWGEKQTPAD